MPDAIVTEDPRVWEDEILAYEAARPSPPPGRVLFVGSSTVRLWSTLEADMAPLPVVGRGFGGAQADAVLHYAPRLVLPLAPVAVVFCAGENDLEPIRGKAPARVVADVGALWNLLAPSPGLRRLYLLAIKASPARRASWDAARACNRLFGELAGADDALSFVDVATPMLGVDGEPDPSLFLEDGLHLSARGYALWTAVLRPRLVADAARERWFPGLRLDGKAAPPGVSGPRPR